MLGLSVAGRLLLVVGTAITMVLLISGWYLTTSVGGKVDQLAKGEMESLLSSAEVAVQAYNEQLVQTAEHLSAVFGEAFSEDFALDPNQQVVGGESVPVLLNGNREIAGNFSSVDRFARDTGGNATIFVKRDNDFVRIITSVKKQDGSRAIGTLLSRSSPAYAANIAGNSFTGKVTLFGKRFITNYSPISNSQGEVIGIRYIGISFEESLKNLKNGLADIAVGENGYIFAVDSQQGESNGQFIIHPQHEGKNSLTSDRANVIATLLTQQQGNLQHSWPADESAGGEQWYTTFTPLPEFQWVIGVTKPLKELEAVSVWVRAQMLVTILITIVVVAVLLWYAVRRVISEPLSRAGQILKTIAAGDYSQDVVVKGKDEVAQLMIELKSMQQQVKDVLLQISRTSTELGCAAGDLSLASRQVADGSGEQGEAAAQIASTMEQLTVSIDSLAANAREVRDHSDSSYSQCERGAQVISRAGEKMLSISETVRSASDSISQLGSLSEQVSGIIEVIEMIAEQTNLLALNAAIEAARAGEQGRGFAVVADEVRSLAGRTTESAKEISTTVRSIQDGTRQAVDVMSGGVEQVNNGAELSNEAGGAIQEIKTSANSVKEMLEQISITLNQQADASTNVAQNVERIAVMTETNSQSVQEVAVSAKDLETMAENLRQLISRFNIGQTFSCESLRGTG